MVSIFCHYLVTLCADILKHLTCSSLKYRFSHSIRNFHDQSKTWINKTLITGAPMKFFTADVGLTCPKCTRRKRFKNDANTNLSMTSFKIKIHVSLWKQQQNSIGLMPDLNLEKKNLGLDNRSKSYTSFEVDGNSNCGAICCYHGSIFRPTRYRSRSTIFTTIIIIDVFT